MDDPVGWDGVGGWVGVFIHLSVIGGGAAGSSVVNQMWGALWGALWSVKENASRMSDVVFKCV